MLERGTSECHSWKCAQSAKLTVCWGWAFRKLFSESQKQQADRDEKNGKFIEHKKEKEEEEEEGGGFKIVERMHTGTTMW